MGVRGGGRGVGMVVTGRQHLGRQRALSERSTPVCLARLRTTGIDYICIHLQIHGQ